MATYPATTYAEGVDLTITSGNQLHEIINGTATSEVTTESGLVPSVRKAIADSMLFKPAIAWADGSVETDPLQTRIYNGQLFWAPQATSATPIAMGTSPLSDSNWFLAPVSANKENYARNTNLLSNHNFTIASPDSITHPSATPTNYVAGTQIFSGVYADDTTGVDGVTFVNGLLSFTGGSIYMEVAKTGVLENVNDFVASVSDLEGAVVRDRGVSFSLVGDSYRIVVDTNALTDVGGNVTPLGSVKFEQGLVATGHEVSSLPVNNLSNYTDIVYRSSNGNSAVENMINGVPISIDVDQTCQCESGTIFKRVGDSTRSIDDFIVIGSANVRDFGAIGDGVTDDSDSFIYAIKASSNVVVTDGSYFLDYIQASGDPLEVDHYIGRSDLHIEAVGDVTIISKSYVGDTPPPDLGLKYGFEPSTFSLNGFESVIIKGFKGIGPYFDNINEDIKPIIASLGSGTYHAYNTRSKFISVNFSQNVNISDISTEKYYGSIYYRECHNSSLEDCNHRYSRQSYLFQDCNTLKVSRVNSTDARFSLSGAQNDWGNVAVYNRSGTLQYEAIPTASGDTEGAKLIGGYGFVSAGNINSVFRDCSSSYAGSECFRSQNGPTGRKSSNVKFIDCISFSTARYALSTRALTNDTQFINCKVTRPSDINFYNQAPPSSASEVINPVLVDIDTHWQFRIPRTSNAAMYSNGSRDVYRDCLVITNDTMKVDDLAKQSALYVDGFSAYGMAAGVQSNLSSGIDNKFYNNEFYGQCTSSNGYFQFFGGSTTFEGNKYVTSAGISTSENVTYCVGIRGDMDKLHFRGNSIKGGVYTLYMVNTSGTWNIADFKSFDNLYDNTGGKSLIRGNNQQHVYRLISSGDVWKGDTLFSLSDETSASIWRILFDNTTLIVDEWGLDTSASVDCLRLVLFKSGDTFYHRISAASSGPYPWAFNGPRAVMFKSVLREDANYTSIPGDTEGELTERFRSADVTPTGNRKLATIHTNAGTPSALNVDVNGAGTGQSRFWFNGQSSSIYGTYYIEYQPLNFDIVSEF